MSCNNNSSIQTRIDFITEDIVYLRSYITKFPEQEFCRRKLHEDLFALYQMDVGQFQSVVKVSKLNTILVTSEMQSDLHKAIIFKPNHAYELHDLNRTHGFVTISSGGLYIKVIYLRKHLAVHYSTAESYEKLVAEFIKCFVAS